MKWPRGKYNGQRIVGFKIVTRFIINYWRFSVRMQFCNKMIHIGPVIIRFETVYENRKRD